MFRPFRAVLLGALALALCALPLHLSAQDKKVGADLSVYNRLNPKKDFKVEKIYAVPAETQGSWVSMCVDPQGRLIVSDQYGKLFKVTLPPVDDPAKVVKVDPINVDLGEAQGLLWAFDSLYVMVNRGQKYASGLYRVTDKDADGELDTVTKLRDLQGGGEHGPHAIIPSPDGKSLYLCCGNHTSLTKFDRYRMPPVWGEDSLLPRMWDASGHAVGRMAPGGWIARIDPEGKTWELHCGGFRNHYDIAFNKAGELFTYDSDMEWDYNTPWYRPTRVYHCVSGADFAWRGGTAKFPPYYPDTLPPVYDVGPGSPTGVTFGYGAKFPAKYQDAFYICDWSYGKLYAVHLIPEGSTYKAETEEFITGTPLGLTDIVINPKDGAMYFATGGRKSESGLYRVTYVGPEPTAPAPVAKEAPATKKARQLRRQLEKLHGKKDAKLVDQAWPHLGHADRFIRFAARTVLEFQDPQAWQDRALAEKETRTALTALLALTRTGDKSVQPRLLEALGRFDWLALPYDQRLELLRLYGLTFIRLGEPNDQVRQDLIARFDPLFPANDRVMDDELLKLLVYLQAPSAAREGMALVRGALTQEEQMAYVLSLRNLKAGWTPELREEFFRWFVRAQDYKGGHSFQGFVRNIKNEAVAHLSAGEKAALKPILEAKVKSSGPTQAPARPFVKEWKLAELDGAVRTKLAAGRDFERGRKMFAAANCFSCHRYANEGGSTGPDLTGVAGRFSPHDLLESILDPSKSITDQYSAVTVVMDDGRSITGRIVNLAGANIKINTDLYNPDAITDVNRSKIDIMFPSKVSMMPNGLLNTLNEDEILDLTAYLLSRGDRNHPMFRKAGE